MSLVPASLLRFFATGGLTSGSGGIHLPNPVESNSLWTPAAAAVATASTSGNTDLARGNGSVDINGKYFEIFFSNLWL